MTPVTQLPTNDAGNRLPVFFSRELPGGGSAGGGKRPGGKPSGKPGTKKPKGKPSKKR